MKISVDIDLRPLIKTIAGPEASGLQGLDARTHRRFTYASVNAINWAALYVQRDAIENVERLFTIRTAASRKFLRQRAAVLAPRANVSAGRFYAELEAGGENLDSKAPLLLPQFEAGATRRPFTPGAKRVAVPLTGGARPSFSSVVTKELLIGRLGLKPAFSKKVARNVSRLTRSIPAKEREKRRKFVATIGAGQVWKGKQRTYMIPSVGIFQRTSSGKDGTRRLYSFDDDVKLPARLQFLTLAKSRGRFYLTRELEREVSDLLAGRRTQGAPSRLP